MSNWELFHFHIFILFLGKILQFIVVFSCCHSCILMAFEVYRTAVRLFLPTCVQQQPQNSPHLQQKHSSNKLDAFIYSGVSFQASKLIGLNLIFSHHLERIMLQCPQFEENTFERFFRRDQPTYLNSTIE